jgi:putative flippase GtrA
MRRARTTVSAIVSFVSARPHLGRYVLVGVVCTTAQLLAFQALVWAGMASAIANSLTFVLSTQLNFALSDRYTWVHRRRAGSQSARPWAVRCLAFNATAALGLGVNAIAYFGVHHELGLAPLTAAVAAVAASTMVTYVLSSWLVFAVRPHVDVEPLTTPMGM